MHNLEGCRFGRLIAMFRELRPNGRQAYRCICDCGREASIAVGKLTGGHTNSCGCLRLERCRAVVTKHGLTPNRASWPPLYARWLTMKSRCYNPRFPKFKDYGARGIVVCDEWRKDFVRFAADMGPPPSPRHTLDRRDNNGPYAPWNCRWATPKEQRANQRKPTVSRHACPAVVTLASSFGITSLVPEIGAIR